MRSYVSDRKKRGNRETETVGQGERGAGKQGTTLGQGTKGTGWHGVRGKG